MSNTSPVVTSTAVTSVNLGAAYSYAPKATDSDNDLLVWTVKAGTSLPAGLTLSSTMVVSTLAGRAAATSPTSSSTAQANGGFVDGSGSDARFNMPYGFTIDSQGNLFVADWQNDAIRKVTPAGVVTTFATLASPASSINEPKDVAIGPGGILYVADTGRDVIYQLDSSGNKTVYAGVEGTSGTTDNIDRLSAKFNNPNSIAFYNDSGTDYMYVADRNNNQIRVINMDTGMVSTLATGFNQATGVSVDSRGDVFVADRGAGTESNPGTGYVKKITTTTATTGTVTTIATLLDGTSDESNPYDVMIDNFDNVYVAGWNANKIFKLTPNFDKSVYALSTLVGGANGHADDGANSTFSRPIGLATDQNGYVYVADHYNNTIRKIEFGTRLTGTPTTPGTYTVSLTVSDGTNLVDQVFQLVVNNAAPTITNLGADSTTWVNSSTALTLDQGTLATVSDSELGALNSGNGDWSGATLTVQRQGTANAADVLGFNTSGALFTVSGSDLQSGGSTFATFTNTGGLLTITFTSSGTAATTALVQNVVQRITYLNATPSGDTTVRFTLNDGQTGSTTADVTVVSDAIYIDTATDTATIDKTNGVSFSEAVGIALADVTGTQTLVLKSGLGNITLAGNLAIAESLTLNQAGTARLSGSTLTINSGQTLTTTGAGLYLLNGLAGDGNLTINNNDGTNVLVTGNNSGLTSNSTVTLVTGGLEMESATALGSATIIAKAVISQGGITGNSNAVTIGNAIKFFDSNSYLNLSGSALTLSGTVDLNAGDGHIYNSSGTTTSLSGVVSNGNLYVERGTVVLSGSNTYDKTYVGGSSNVTVKIAGDSNLGTGAIYLTSASNLASSTVNVLEITGTGEAINNAIVMNAFNGGGTIKSDNNVTLSGQISGVNSWATKFYKTGTGILTLSGTSDYISGALNVEAGAVNITGALNNAATATIASGAAFGGSGAFGGTTTVQSGGKLGIDGGAGRFTIDDNLILSAGATLSTEINGTTAGTNYDQTVVNGTVNVSGATLSLSGSYTPVVGNSFVLVDNDGTDTITGTFTGLAEGATVTVNGTPMKLSYVGGTNSNDITLTAPMAFGALALSADTGTPTTDFITNTAAQTVTATLSSALGVTGITIWGSVDNGANWTNVTSKVDGTTLTWNTATLGSSNMTLKLEARNASSVVVGSASQAYELDTTAPTTTVATLTFSADTAGASTTDFITKTAAQTISGTLSASTVTGETVQVSLDGSTWLDATNVVGQNTWTVDQTLTASNTLKVRVMDRAGNAGTERSQAYVLDTGLPTASVSAATVSITTNVTTSQSTELGTIYLVNTGTAVTDMASLEAAVNAGSPSATKATVTAGGSNTPIGTTGLSAGSYKVYAVDAAGNVSLASTNTITLVLNQPPVITSNGGGATASVNVVENATAVTTLTATDYDVGNTIGYSITGGADQANFQINASTGVLTFLTAPNFEAPTDNGSDNTYQVAVTANDGQSGTDVQTITVNVTNVNEPPTGAVTISGTPVQGQPLAASSTLSDEDGMGIISYQWIAAGVAVPGATGSTFTLGQDQVGQTLTVKASYTDALGAAESKTSSATAAVANTNDAPTGGVTISGTPTQGQTLTAANTLSDADGPAPLTISYQWRANGVDITGATGGTLLLDSDQVGKAISVVARYTDSGGTSERVSSTPSAVVITNNTAPSLLTLNPALTDSRIQENTSTTSRILVANIVVADDAHGSNTLSLTGTDAKYFEIAGTALYLKAGMVLDFETQSSYQLAVQVNDSTLPASPAVSAGFTLTVVNVEEGTPVTPQPELTAVLPPVTEWPSSPDKDGDGTPEAVEDYVKPLDVTGAVAGDGNGDGTADALQQSVASVPFLKTPTALSNPGVAPPVFVSLVADSKAGKPDTSDSNSAQLENVLQKDAPANLPAEVKMPLGLISFDAVVGLSGISGVGVTETFSLYVDQTLGINGYWKLDANNTWVNLASAVYGGAIVTEGGKTRLDFKITDGGEFDADRSVNGTIVDPGAAGFVPMSLVGYAPESWLSLVGYVPELPGGGI
jgi:hypothetical protein